MIAVCNFICVKRFEREKETRACKRGVVRGGCFKSFLDLLLFRVGDLNFMRVWDWEANDGSSEDGGETLVFR